MFFKKIFICFAALLLLVSCSQQKEPKNTIRVGVIAGPESQIMDVAKKVAKEKYGLNIKIVQFNDYMIPNEALAHNEIDANMFQHLPYLKYQIKRKNYSIISIGKTFVYPVGIYSKKIKKLSELKDGAKVATPNDPSNEARALLLLQKAGVIKLRDGGTIYSNVKDIISNPKQLTFQTLDAAQIPRVLNDVDIAVINTNYAIAAGLIPKKDAIFMESKTSPYANIVAIRASDKKDTRYQQLLDALHSKAAIKEAQKLFKGQAIKAW